MPIDQVTRFFEGLIWELDNLYCEEEEGHREEGGNAGKATNERVESPRGVGGAA